MRWSGDAGQSSRCSRRTGWSGRRPRFVSCRYARPAVLLCLLGAMALTAAPSLDAQRRPDRREENRMLREASTHEARGELAEAEATLRELLKRQPRSSSAILSLERVLRADERIADLLPVLDARLADQPAANHVWALKLKVLTEIGREDELKETVRQWIAAVPDAPDPYRDGARALREALGPGEAAEVIQEGLAALGDSPRMLVELGDALIAAERADEGATAWARALRLDPERDADIRGRLEELGDEMVPVSAAIVAALVSEPVTLPGLEVAAALALAAGDSTAALEARVRITDLYPPGTSDRTSAWAEELRIRVAAGDPEEAATALAAFRDAHPESSDLDELAATLAPRLLARGMREAALAVLEGIEGPGAALERAFLLLEGGAIPDGIAALQAALPDLAPSLATEMLDLALALSEVTTVGAALAAKAAIARHRGRSGEAVGIVREGIDRVPAPDRPAILALGARAADEAGLGAEATAFRRRIVAEHHDAREYPEAALMLARSVALEPGGRDEALGILEALIVGHPESPVVPGARRELDRIRAGGVG